MEYHHKQRNAAHKEAQDAVERFLAEGGAITQVSDSLPKKDLDYRNIREEGFRRREARRTKRDQ